MNHHASPAFWSCLRGLPTEVRELAEKAFAQLKADPNHPSLHFKKVGRYWSARVGLYYRAVAVEAPDGLVWFWVGSHAEYDRLLG